MFEVTRKQQRNDVKVQLILHHSCN